MLRGMFLVTVCLGLAVGCGSVPSSDTPGDSPPSDDLPSDVGARDDATGAAEDESSEPGVETPPGRTGVPDLSGTTVGGAIPANTSPPPPAPPSFFRIGGPIGMPAAGRDDPLGRSEDGAVQIVLTAIPEGDERTPVLPWRFEIVQLSGWMPGPRGLAIDASGVLWSYDHSRTPWTHEDITGNRVTAAELADKYAGAEARFVLDDTVLAAMASLVPAASQDPLTPHAPWTLDLVQTYLAYEYDPRTDRYTEVVLASTGESRAGDATQLLVRWGDCFLAPGSRPRPEAPAGLVASLSIRTEEFLDAFPPENPTKPTEEDR